MQKKSIYICVYMLSVGYCYSTRYYEGDKINKLNGYLKIVFVDFSSYKEVNKNL